MPARPLPCTSSLAPRPSSRAWIVTWRRASQSNASHRLRAWAWRAVLVIISCAQRSSTWARRGSSTPSCGGSCRWMARPGTPSTRSRNAWVRSMVSPSRNWLTTSRTSPSSSLATDCACRMCVCAWPCTRWLATSRLRLSAVRWWPTRSCSSREMRMRSPSRLDSASSARVARSSELRRRCSSRASTCCLVTSAVTNASTMKPEYRLDCRNASLRLNAGSRMLANTGTSEKFCSTIQAMPTRNGSNHGNTTATTASSNAEMPLWLNQPIATAMRLSTTSSAICTPRRSGERPRASRSRVRYQ